MKYTEWRWRRDNSLSARKEQKEKNGEGIANRTSAKWNDQREFQMALEQMI